jgi:type II secretory pathway component PulF
VAHRLKEGLDLNRALMDVGLFPPFFLRILAVAEKSGKLAEVLETLASYCERKYQFSNQWIQSLLYPGLLFLVSLGVLGIVFQWVFPSFLELFRQWDRPLPWQTRLVFNVGNWMWSYLGLFLILALLAVYWIRSYRHKYSIWIKFLLRFPMLHSILKKKNACEVAHNLSLLLTSGFQVPESFALAGEGQPFIQEELLKFKIHLEEGREFDEGIVLDSIFPREFLKMLSVGFKTGNLAETCQKVSGYYERDLNIFLNRFTALLGPILLLGVGVFIGFLVIGVLLPVFDWSF